MRKFSSFLASFKNLSEFDFHYENKLICSSEILERAHDIEERPHVLLERVNDIVERVHEIKERVDDIVERLLILIERLHDIVERQHVLIERERDFKELLYKILYICPLILHN